MDLQDAVRFSLHRLNLEFTSPGSIFSIYSLATSLTIGFCALAWLHWKRRGRIKLRALARAIFAQKLLLRESTLADLQLFIISVIFMPAIVTGLVISANTVASSVHTMLNGLFGVIEPFACCSLWTRISSTVVLFIAYEIGYWIDHYLKHRVPFLWEFHKLHHTADVLTPLTNFRNHPIDNIVFGWMLAIFIGGASGVLAWLFNQPAQSFTVDGKNILFIIFLWTIGHLQHSQFWIPFRGFWGNLVLSPAHHQIHHSRDPAHYNRNLGSVLAIWDKAFGTLEIPAERNPRLFYGADNAGADPHSTYGILITPIIRAAFALGPGLGSLAKTGAETWSALSGKLSRARSG